MVLVSSNSASPWRKFKKTVPASSTVDVDNLAYGTYGGSYYIVNVSNCSNNIYTQFIINAIKNPPSDIKDSIVQKLGTPVDISLNVLVVGSEVRVRITNNESFQLDVVVSRLITS